MTTRIVAAYGGSLDGAAALAALGARLDAELVTVTLDLGQGADLEGVCRQARAAGAVRAHVVDARQGLAADVIRPALSAGAFDGSAHATAVTRPVVAAELVRVARMEGAAAVAHGAAGADRAVFDRLLAELAPELEVHALVEEHVQRSVPAGVVQHLWARVVTLPALPGTGPLPYLRTSAPAALASHPAVVALAVERGVPVAVNGVRLELEGLIEVIDTIAGDHGVGRFESADQAQWTLVEAPAAVVLGAAVRELAAVALAPELAAIRAQVAAAYDVVLAEGRWHAPTRRALDAFTAASAETLTGTVTLELADGRCRVLSAVPCAAGLAAPAYS